MNASKLLLGIATLSFLSTKAQVTNTFPDDGNVGIGTTNPLAKLQVQGSGTIGGIWNPSGSFLTITDGGGSTIMDPNEFYGTGTLHIGSRSGDVVKFRTVQDSGSAFDWMIVKGNGNVGIGTTSPTRKLHIKANGDDGIALSSENALLGDNGSGIFTQLLFWNGNNAYYGRNATGASVDNHYFRTGGADRMSIVSNGKVGIGNSNPLSKLTISNNGTTGGPHHSYSDVTIEDPGKAMVNLLSLDTGTGYYGFSDVNDSYVGGIQYDHNLDHLIFRVNNHPSADLVLDDNGDMGLGTSNPNGWKLAVKGKIRAEEIKVETGWADYVFEDDYDLPTLEEVEKHIQEKGHLINIPSAKEVEENGIQLGEMNKLLLEKIEELTLYVIQQQQQINTMEKELEKLKKK